MINILIGLLAFIGAISVIGGVILCAALIAPWPTEGLGHDFDRDEGGY